MGFTFAKMILAIAFAAETHFIAESRHEVKTVVPMNAVLFSEGEQSWTQRDFNLYKKILNHIPKKGESVGASESLPDDFLISRLLSREALLFEIHPEKLELSSGFKTDAADYSKVEINEELKVIALSRALLDFKEKQMSQKIRYKAWIEVLKRKYAVRIKASEFAKTLR